MGNSLSHFGEIENKSESFERILGIVVQMGDRLVAALPSLDYNYQDSLRQ